MYTLRCPRISFIYLKANKLVNHLYYNINADTGHILKPRGSWCEAHTHSLLSNVFFYTFCFNAFGLNQWVTQVQQLELHLK